MTPSPAGSRLRDMTGATPPSFSDFTFTHQSVLDGNTYRVSFSEDGGEEPGAGGGGGGAAAAFGSLPSDEGVGAAGDGAGADDSAVGPSASRGDGLADQMEFGGAGGRP